MINIKITGAVISTKITGTMINTKITGTVINTKITSTLINTKMTNVGQYIQSYTVNIEQTNAETSLPNDFTKIPVVYIINMESGLDLKNEK